jgi:hypothetical protein
MRNVKTSEIDPNAEAMALTLARPSLLELFLEITDRSSLNIPWNPMEDPPKWEGEREPTNEDFRRMAAAKVLIEKGFLSSVTDEGVGRYTLVATDEAMAVRRAYESLARDYVSKAKERFSRQ